MTTRWLPDEMKTDEYQTIDEDNTSDPELRAFLDQRKAERARKRKASWRDDPPSEKQIKYLRDLGHRGPKPKTKGEAADIIDERLKKPEDKIGKILAEQAADPRTHDRLPHGWRIVG